MVVCRIFKVKQIKFEQINGFYDYANAPGSSLAFLSELGLPTAVLQLISEYRIKHWAYLRGIMEPWVLPWQQQQQWRCGTYGCTFGYEATANLSLDRGNLVRKE